MAHTYQFVLLPILLGLVFYVLKQIKFIWFSDDYSFDEKQQNLVLYQILLCISVFATKMCICFDHKISKPWIDGAFARISNTYTFGMSLALSGNAIISYHIFGSDIPSMICLSVFTIIQLWILLALTGRNVRPLLSAEPKVVISEAICHTLSEEYRQELVFEEIGWSHFATTYRTRLTNIDNNSDAVTELAVKLIDMNAYRLFHLDYESPQELIRNNCEYKLLTQISHQNIAPFLKIKRIPPQEEESVRQLVLVSKLAPFSLDSYISTICPLGIGQKRAQLWFNQLVDAVYFLHHHFNKGEPIPHLSIKPENILLFQRNDENNEFDVKLNDCGLEKYFTKSGQITTDNNRYIISPPEFIFGRKVIRMNKKRITPTQALAADIFSLGVVLIVLIKGEVKRFYENQNEGSQKVAEMRSEAIAKYVDFSWKNWKKSSLKSEFRTEENKCLISSLLKGMLQKNWEKRLDITSVKRHKWLLIKMN